MKPAITEMEYISPKLLETKYSTPWYVWAVFGATILATISYFFIPSPPQIHVETKQLTDFQQERNYCAMWAMNIESVEGGTTDQIRKHCQKYL